MEKEPEVQIEGSKTVLSPEYVMYHRSCVACVYVSNSLTVRYGMCVCVLCVRTIERIKQMAKEKRAHEARLAGEDVEKAVAGMMTPAAPQSAAAAAAPAPMEVTGPVPFTLSPLSFSPLSLLFVSSQS